MILICNQGALDILAMQVYAAASLIVINEKYIWTNFTTLFISGPATKAFTPLLLIFFFVKK